MAVVQISKIQVRRGRKLEVGTVPQLSSAEMAWAVDTQELYIGNGSLAEGAPYVGNTKILTEHDNILELANSYRFASDDPAISRSEFRSLQSKLDETVSVFDYGAVPDGSTDCTDAFEAAFQDLYKSSNTAYRKILLIPNGVYLFNIPNRPLRIPSWAILRGENRNETILNIENSGIVFVSENGTSPNDEIGFTDSNYPEHVKISNLTILHKESETEITASRNCEFDSVTWRSNYKLGDEIFIPENANAKYSIPQINQGGRITVAITGVTDNTIQEFVNDSETTLKNLVETLNTIIEFQGNFEATSSGTELKITTKNSTDFAELITDNILVSVRESGQTAVDVVVEPETAEFSDGSENVNASVFWNNKSFSTRTTENVFRNCKFESSKLGIECRQQELFDTLLQIDKTVFKTCDTGIYISGVEPLNDISQGNIWSINDSLFEEIATHAFISTFGSGTKFSRCTFKNCGNGKNSSEFPVAAIVKFGEIFNNVLVDCSSDRHQAAGIKDILQAEPDSSAVVEFENANCASLIDKNKAKIFINQKAVLSTFSSLNSSIELEYQLTMSLYSRRGRLTMVVDKAGNLAVYDEYTYSTPKPSDVGGQFLTSFEFIGEISTEFSNTLVLYYRNPIQQNSEGVNGTISYSITYGT